MTRKAHCLSVVIPAYNESGAVRKVVQDTYDALSTRDNVSFEIIVVDDGSTDGTGDRVPLEFARVISHPKNYGYGRSLLTGIENASYPLIGILDADGTYDPNDLVRMLPLMSIHDMVIGARRITQQSPVLAFLRIVLKTLIFLFSEHVSLDPNSGIRIFSRDLVQRGKALFSRKFSFSTSLTFYAALNHQFIEYIPIEYAPRTGESKIRRVRDSIRTFALIMSMALIHQPVKCFLGQAVWALAGFCGLSGLRRAVSRDTWLTSLVAWLSLHVSLALSFVAFILAKSYEQREPKP